MEELHKYLKESPNPFINSVVGDVWEDIQDVSEINQSISDKVYNAINISNQSSINQMLLILGEPGLGKTHLLARIQRKAEEKHDFLFVYVRPVGDIAKINQHILRELMISLLRPSKNRKLPPLIQFTLGIVLFSLKDIKNSGKMTVDNEEIYNKILKFRNESDKLYDFLQKLSLDQRNSLIEPIISFITINNPEIDSTFLRVLFYLLDPKLRIWAQDWLKAIDLDEGTLDLLQIKKSITSEDYAFKTLQAILKLSKGCVLLCFDQLESVYDRFLEERGISILFDFLMNYFNTFRNLVILIMCNTQYWSENISSNISSAAKGRINHVLNLKSLNKSEAIHLVEKRMNILWEGYKNQLNLPYESFPFTHDFILSESKNTGWNPRGLIRRVSEKFEMIKKEPILHEIITSTEENIANTEYYQNENQKVEKLQAYIEKIFNSYAQDCYTTQIKSMSNPEKEDTIIGFFNDLFKECARNNWTLFDWSFIDIKPNIRKNKNQKPLSFLISLQNQQKKRLILTHITNSDNGVSLSSYTKRIKEYLLNNTNWNAIIVRDEEMQIEGRFNASQKIIEELSQRIKVVYVPEIQLSIILAMKILLEKATGGDLQMETYIIKRSEILKFIYNTIHEETFFLRNIFSINEEKRYIQQPSVSDTSNDIMKPYNPEFQGTFTQQNKKSNSVKEVDVKKDIIILEKILRILKHSPLINVTTLYNEIAEMPRNAIDNVCKRMEQEELITILSVKAENGFLIASRPKKDIIGFL